MSNFRSYVDQDYKAYLLFCQRNFRNTYQKKIEHIQWLKSHTNHFFNIIEDDNKILGCFHGFLAPVKVDNQVEYFYSLHDLMVDKDHRDGLGLSMIQKSIFQDKPVILSGALGRVSQAYKNLGSVKINSQWFRKFIIPKNIFGFYLSSLNKVNRLANKSMFIFCNNKDPQSSRHIIKILDTFEYDEATSNYFNWRFFHKSSPITFFVSDKKYENIVIFSVGTRKKIPFLRIFCVRKGDESTFAQILNDIEVFASSIGIPVVLYSTAENIAPPDQSNFKPYADAPDSYWFCKNKKTYVNSGVEINGFSVDTGFEGYYFSKYE